MSLKNLAQRYEERVNQLYAGATLKFENGKPSRGFNDDPLNVRRVGNESFGGASRALGRFLPVARATQDTLRLTKFLASVRGLVFLGKQALLQTGNTFEITRLLNPVFVLGAAAAPGAGNIVRIRRHLNPFSTLLSRTDTSYPNVKTLGLLQVSTWDKNFLKPTANQFVLSDLKPTSPFNAKRNIGDVDGFGYDSQGFKRTRPELKDYIGTIHNDVETYNTFKFGGIVGKRNTYGAVNSVTNSSTKYNTTHYELYYRISPASNTNATGSNGLSDYTSRSSLTPLGIYEVSVIQTNRRDLLSGVSAGTTLTNKQSYLSSSIYEDRLNYIKTQTPEFIKYFTPGQHAIKNRSDSTDPRKASTIRRPISYIKDSANITGSIVQNRLSRYNTLPSTIDDPITVSFAMGNNETVPFRAFIKDLTHSVSPEYKTNQYIGRVEKFVNFVSVQRELSFKLGVIAFSKDELDVVWTRINYLTGMVFPYGIYRGIFQPNIIRLTIGKLFENQYGYITSLNTNFTDISETWDIDAKIPIGATIDMKFSIIEKRVMTANSPFYAINE